MSRKLANKLLKAESAQAFLRSQKGVIEWQTFSALKSEIDALTGRDLNAAARLSLRISELAALVGDRIAKAFAEACRARVLHQQSRPSEAIKYYNRAIKTLRQANLKTEAAVLQKSQVDAFKRLGRFAEALSTAQSARRALKKAGRVQLGQLETNIGNVYYQQDQYKKALMYYNRAGTIFAAAGEEAMQALVDLNRADIFIEIDQPDKALALFERSAKAFERSGDSLNAVEARFHMAYINFLRGNYNQALTGYYKVREGADQLGYARLLAWCDLEIAEMLLALNAFEDAFESATSARNQFAELEFNYEAAKSSIIRGLAAAGLAQFAEAEADFLKARKTFAQKQNKVFTAITDTYLAELAIHRNDYREASRRAALAQQTFAGQKLPTKSAYTRLLAAQGAYRQKDFVRAKRLAKTALQNVANIFAPTIAYQAHHLLGKIERDSKRPALEYFRRAVETVEKMRAGIAADEFKTIFLQDKVEVYENAIKAYLDAGNEMAIEEAFKLVESSKSRALADLIARYVRDSESATQGALNAESRQRLAQLVEELNWYAAQAGLEEDKGNQRRADLAERYRHEVAKREKQIAQLFRRLESEGSTFADAQTNVATGIKDLRHTLEADETAIEFFITGDEISAFIASPDRVKIIRNLASKSAIEKTITALRFQIEKFNYGAAYVNAYFGQLKRTADGHLSQLYQALFAPLEADLASEKLIIIPHGSLHYMPFHALRAEAKYLVEDYEISYAPSASVLKLCRIRQQQLAGEINPQRSGDNQRLSDRTAQTLVTNKKMAGTTMLAVGVVESGTPSIEEEIFTLGSLFPGAIRLTGNQATHGNLLRHAPQAQFLHLASHGYFRRDNPMFSFLKLADANLNFYGLLDLQLKAELVTLSACHTGVNAIFPGDELHGLMRGFLYAGAPSMVVSLWAVNDRSTADFMREMYSHIQTGKSKRAAIRAAQLAIKELYGHPYYWAPFILMGDTASATIG